MIRKLQEHIRNTSLAERALTLIALGLLVITGLVWFIGSLSDNANPSATQTTSTMTMAEESKVKAEEAVTALEKSNTDDNLKAAQDAVEKLSDKSLKEQLQKRIDTVAVAMKKKTEEVQKAKLKAELVRAEAAKKLAEEQNKPNEETPASSTEEAQVAEVPTETDSYVAEDSYVYEESYTYQPVYGGGQSSSTSSSSSAPQQSSTPSQPSAPAPVVEEPVVTPPSSSEEVAPSEPEPVAPSSSETDSTVDSSASGE